MLKETLATDVAILAKYWRFIMASDPLVGDIPTEKKLHSGGAIYRSENKKIEIPLGIMSSEVLVKVEDVYNFNLEKICTDIYDFAQQMLKQMTVSMFETLTQVTDFTGNVVDGKGKGISHEMLLEMLDKIYMDFDEEGNPQFPSMIVHPDMANHLQKLKAEEGMYKVKYDEIIERKRKAYYAEKGCRGLSRID